MTEPAAQAGRPRRAAGRRRRQRDRRLVGAPVRVQPYRPVLRAMLLSGRAPLYLRNPPAEDEVAAPDSHLAHYLATHGELQTVG